MTKYFFFNKEFDTEILHEFIKFLNTLQETDTVEIIIHTNGGRFDILESFLHIINNSRYVSKIVATGEVSSCGLYLVIFANCEVIVTSGAYGVFHQSSRTIAFNSKGKPAYTESEFHLNQCKVANNTEAFLLSKIDLSKKERKRFDDGDDVYLDAERIREIIDLNLDYQ